MRIRRPQRRGRAPGIKRRTWQTWYTLTVLAVFLAWFTTQTVSSNLGFLANTETTTLYPQLAVGFAIFVIGMVFLILLGELFARFPYLFAVTYTALIAVTLIGYYRFTDDMRRLYILAGGSALIDADLLNWENRPEWPGIVILVCFIAFGVVLARWGDDENDEEKSFVSLLENRLIQSFIFLFWMLSVVLITWAIVFRGDNWITSIFVVLGELLGLNIIFGPGVFVGGRQLNELIDRLKARVGEGAGFLSALVTVVALVLLLGLKRLRTIVTYPYDKLIRPVVVWIDKQLDKLPYVTAHLENISDSLLMRLQQPDTQESVGHSDPAVTNLKDAELIQ